MAAIRMRSTKHPTIAKAWDEHNFWTRYGTHIDPRPMCDRPWREFAEYKVLTRLEIQWENTQRELARRKAASPVHAQRR